MPDINLSIEQNKKHFTKAQRLLATFISEHADKAAFSTSFELASLVGVSQSSVIRFATALGFDGYNALRRELLKNLRHRFTAMEELELTHEFETDRELIAAILRADAESMLELSERLDTDMLLALCHSIKKANKIYIYGQDLAGVAAQYLSAQLHIILPNICCVNQLSFEPMATIANIGANDLLLVISLTSLSSLAKRLVAYAEHSDAKTAIICESYEKSDINDGIILQCGYGGINASLTPFISLCTAINGLLIYKNDETSLKLRAVADITEFEEREL